MNKVILIGNLGKDPIVRYIDEDVPVAKFSLVTTEYVKRKTGEKVSQAEWHNIVVWRESAKYAESKISKGDKVVVEGKVKTRSWENKEGVQRYITEIIANSIILLIKKEGNQEIENSDGNNQDINELDVNGEKFENDFSI